MALSTSQPKVHSRPAPALITVVLVLGASPLTSPMVAAAADPFAGVEDDISGGSTDAGYVHIRVQKRNGRKCITTISGIDPKIDLKKVLKSFKKDLSCNGESLVLQFARARVARVPPASELTCGYINKIRQYCVRRAVWRSHSGPG